MTRLFANAGIIRRVSTDKINRLTSKSVRTFAGRNDFEDNFNFQDNRSSDRSRKQPNEFGSFFQDSFRQPTNPRGFGNNDDAGFANSLRPIDWSKEELEPFAKDFYKDRELPHIKNMSQEEVDRVRSESGMIVHGDNIPNPVSTFEETTLDDVYLQHLTKMGLTEPSAIQKQGIPMALSGRDLVGVSKTGSGKTLAFILPAIVHINSQPLLKPGDGPICLVLSPTRELAVQIDNEVRKFASSGAYTAISHTCVYGGAKRGPQIAMLRRQPEILIATPGRLLDFLECGQVKLNRTTYLVMDEADRMLEMGFQQDIEKILSQCRPDRQTVMFSATWPKEVQHIASSYTTDAIRVQIGSLDLKANENIHQSLKYVDPREKDHEFVSDIAEVVAKGHKTLVFSNSKKNCDRLCYALLKQNIPSDSIHGDRTQMQRDQSMKDFRTGRTKVMIATDVVARGIDIRDIRVVVNYDMPTNIESYVHRIGRTARGTDRGVSLGYVVSEDLGRIGKDLRDILSRSGQKVPSWLSEALAQMQQSRTHATSRQRYKMPPRKF
jgi:ATP-dependent RNA helicase DDX5/DBP2